MMPTQSNCVIRMSVWLTCDDCGAELDISNRNLETGRVQVRRCGVCCKRAHDEGFRAGVRATREALLKTASMTEVIDHEGL